MKIYQVIEKMFYVVNGVDYQVADAMRPITTYSSNKKAQRAYKEYIEHYKTCNYDYTNGKNDCLFPMQHIELQSKITGMRVVIYILESEVE